MIQSMMIVNTMVGHGTRTVSMRSRRRRGVVRNLRRCSADQRGSEEDHRKCYSPIDVAHVEDLSVVAVHNRSVAMKLNIDGSPSCL